MMPDMSNNYQGEPVIERKVRVYMKDDSVIEVTPSSYPDFKASDVRSIHMVVEDEFSEKAYIQAHETIGAMRAFLRNNSDFLKSYKEDFEVRDVLGIMLNPYLPFIWVVRELGTHLFLLEGDPDPEKLDKEELRIEEMMEYMTKNHSGNGVCFFKWEDKPMQMTDYTTASIWGVRVLRERSFKARKGIAQ